MNSHYYKLSREEMLAFLPGNIESLLDVGCAEGNFGFLVKEKYGCTVYGIEPMTKPFEIAKTKLDKVYNTFFDSSFDCGMKFDVITFNDVLEHIADPWKALKKCTELLNKDGVVVASIPNILYFHDFFKMIIERDFKYEEAGIFDKTHLRFFTKKSMQRMFEESGFGVQKIEGIRPTDSKKFYLFNIATMGYWAESQFLQYAVVAKTL